MGSLHFEEIFYFCGKQIQAICLQMLFGNDNPACSMRNPKEGAYEKARIKSAATVCTSTKKPGARTFWDSYSATHFERR